MAKRKATLIDPETLEKAIVERGTPAYEQFKEQGYISKEQASHNEKYKDLFQPDEIESPEETNTDYPDVDDKELLKQRIEDMYDTIMQRLDEIPDDKYVEGKYIDLKDSKQMLFSLVDDLYAEAESDDAVNYYLKMMMAKIVDLVEAIYWDSTEVELDYHLSLLANILNQGKALTFEQASTMAESTEIRAYRPLGYHEKSSMLRDRY